MCSNQICKNDFAGLFVIKLLHKNDIYLKTPNRAISLIIYPWKSGTAFATMLIRQSIGSPLRMKMEGVHYV
jgi:hypothetical protein